MMATGSPVYDGRMFTLWSEQVEAVCNQVVKFMKNVLEEFDLSPSYLMG